MKSSPKIILSDEFGDGVTYTSASHRCDECTHICLL